MTAPAPACVQQADSDSFYVGPPGALRRLPMPDSGITRSPVRGGATHTLISAGSTVTRRPTVKQQYAASWSQLTPDVADELIALYAGTRRNSTGDGPPYCLLDPSYRNLLDEPASTGGMARGANTAWHRKSSGGLLALDFTVTPPPLAALAGVLRWPSPAAGDAIWNGAFDPTLTVYQLPVQPVPYAPELPYLGSLWMRFDTAPASTTVDTWVYACTDTGWDGVHFAQGINSFSDNAWHRVQASVPAGLWAGLGIRWLGLAFSVRTAPGRDVLIGGADLQVRTSSHGLLPWVTGLGCPRVVIPDGMGDASSVWWRRSHTLTMLER